MGFYVFFTIETVSVMRWFRDQASAENQWRLWYNATGVQSTIRGESDFTPTAAQ